MSLPAWAPVGVDQTLDALGLRCPLPVLKVEARLRAMAIGQRLAVRTDDPMATLDVPHAATSGGNECQRIGDTVPCVFVVTRRAGNSQTA